MSTWKDGDRVKIVNRPVVDEDRRKGQYYDHMADLTGTVQNVGNLTINGTASFVPVGGQATHAGGVLHELLGPRILAWNRFLDV